MSVSISKVRKYLSHFFRERQIYHRSDGIVRFVKLTTRTQVALSVIVGTFLCWVAYSSVNVVFKEQIIVAKEKERQEQVALYRQKLAQSESAYNDISALNVIFSREFDAAIFQLESRHRMLQNIVENITDVDDRFQSLSDTLSEVGGPNGQHMTNANRVMVDAVGREPTPRQSRISQLREGALQDVTSTKFTQDLTDSTLKNMRLSTAQASAQQALLLANVEHDLRARSKEIMAIFEYTGIETDMILARARIAETTQRQPLAFYGQGGPFIHPNDSTTTTRSTYFKTITRIQDEMDKLQLLDHALRTLPLSTPIGVRHRFSSGFGVRWDPTNRRKRAQHNGADFAGPWSSPILATAPGRVTFAGTRGGFGRTVEIDHGNGFVTRYAHMNRISVRTGQKIQLHSQVGLLGSSGKSTGPHVHYEIHYKGRPVDPMRFIRAGRYVFES